MSEDKIKQKNFIEKQLDYLRADIENKKRIISANGDKIKRLNKAKLTLSGLKYKIGTYVIAENSFSHQNSHSSWKGDNKDKYLSSYDNNVKNSDGDYGKQIDSAIDSINDEITRLENEISNQFGLIGKINAKINSFNNELRNLFN